jgi:hypothetical protein
MMGDGKMPVTWRRVLYNSMYNSMEEASHKTEWANWKLTPQIKEAYATAGEMGG